VPPRDCLRGEAVRARRSAWQRRHTEALVVPLWTCGHGSGSSSSSRARPMSHI
jgi:hypothetical protein